MWEALWKISYRLFTQGDLITLKNELQLQLRENFADYFRLLGNFLQAKLS